MFTQTQMPIVNRIGGQKMNFKQRRKIKEWCHVSTATILQLVIVALLIVFYGVFAMGVLAQDKGSKVGVGNFVMAVSYTESYNDLQYVANFVNCDMALDYYNCIIVHHKVR